MKEMIVAFLSKPEVIAVAASVLATVAVWAWQTILARYAERKWARMAAKYTPLAVDAFLRAEKVAVAAGSNPQDSKTLAFAERFAETFKARYGAEPSTQVLDVVDKIKAELLLNSKN
jgi:uncharacterized NAD(P)/FAD-binding protein YdhS